MKSFYFFLLIITLSSCGINSNLMFKNINESDVVIKDSIPMTPLESYRLDVNDRFTFDMYPQDGEKLVEKTNEITPITSKKLEFTIRQDGKAELPVIGDVHLAGLTIEQCEDTLEYFYAFTNKNPYIQVKVVNKRVIVFPGNGGEAQVVELENENTTLMEVLALAGGIAERGKSRSIKIMRKNGETREVYEIDLSTIQGLPYSDMVVQANDYIYIEPTKELSRGILKEVTPLIGIITSSLAIITIFSQP